MEAVDEYREMAIAGAGPRSMRLTRSGVADQLNVTKVMGASGVDIHRHLATKRETRAQSLSYAGSSPVIRPG